MNLTLNKLIKNFHACINKTEIYQYLIELGQGLPKNNSIRKHQNLVSGCQSQVWIYLDINKNKFLLIEGDGDSLIIKGLIRIIKIIISELELKDITFQSILSIFHKIPVTEHLTPSRSQGLFNIISFIINKIKYI